MTYRDRAAARQDSRKRHAVDIPLALPIAFGHFYLALVGGREQRSAARLATERNRHPLASAGNLAMAGALIALSALAGLALYGIFPGAPLSVTRPFRDPAGAACPAGANAG